MGTEARGVMAEPKDGERLVVAKPGEAEIEVKGSRFRAYCVAAPDRAAARAALEELAHRERRATHLCWALRAPEVDGGSESVKSADAGEPSGTAGRPILAAIDEVRASHVLVAVARTFGGVKLGASGLKRAYHRAALDALRAAVLEPPAAVPARLRLSFPYARLQHVLRIVAHAGGIAASPDCGQRVTLAVQVAPGAVAPLRAALAALPDVAEIPS